MCINIEYIKTVLHVVDLLLRSTVVMVNSETQFSQLFCYQNYYNPCNSMKELWMI